MSDPLMTHLCEARSSLLRANALVGLEIREYPTPISGCDAQFNHLLRERQRITMALAALDKSIFIPTPRSPNNAACVESR